MSDAREPDEELLALTLEYVRAMEGGGGPSLAQLVRRNPRYAQALLEFATDYRSDRRAADDDAVDAEWDERARQIERRALDAAFGAPSDTA